MRMHDARESKEQNTDITPMQTQQRENSTKTKAIQESINETNSNIKI